MSYNPPQGDQVDLPLEGPYNPPPGDQVGLPMPDISPSIQISIPLPSFFALGNLLAGESSQSSKTSFAIDVNFEVSGNVAAKHRPLLWTQVNTMLPRFVVDQHPRFVKFLEEWLRWVERKYDQDLGFDPGPLYVVNNLIPFSDIDQTLDAFISYYRKEFLADYPPLTEAEARLLIKSISSFYKSKGTVRSIRFFFRTVFDTFFSLFIPKHDLIKSSDGAWFVPYMMRPVDPSTGTTITLDQMKDLIDAQVTGQTSGASAVIEEILDELSTFEFDDSLSNDDGGWINFTMKGFVDQKKPWLSMARSRRRFVPGEVVRFDLVDDTYREYHLALSEDPEDRSLQLGPGRYLDENGFPSSRKKLQDNLFWQTFSYEITSDQQLVDLTRPLRLNIHPAGLKLFVRFFQDVKPGDEIKLQPGENDLFWESRWRIVWLSEDDTSTFDLDSRRADLGLNEERMLAPDYGMSQAGISREFFWDWRDTQNPPASPLTVEKGDFENHLMVIGQDSGKLAGGHSPVPGSPFVTGRTSYAGQLNTVLFKEAGQLDPEETFLMRSLLPRSRANTVYVVPQNTGLPFDVTLPETVGTEESVLVFLNGEHVTSKDLEISISGTTLTVDVAPGGDPLQTIQQHSIVDVVPLEENFISRDIVAADDFPLPTQAPRQEDLLLFSEGSVLIPALDWKLENGQIKLKDLTGVDVWVYVLKSHHVPGSMTLKRGISDQETVFRAPGVAWDRTQSEMIIESV